MSEHEAAAREWLVLEHNAGFMHNTPYGEGPTQGQIASLAAKFEEIERAASLSAMQVAKHATDRAERAERERDDEAERIGDKVEQALLHVCRDNRVSDDMDASGCDSGDPADYIASMACKPLVDAINQRDAALAVAAQMRRVLERLVHQPKANDPWFACAGCGGVTNHFDGCDLNAALSASSDADGWLREHDAKVRSDEREACAKVADGGRFLHDDAPDARFGKACAAAIRALP